MNDLKNIRDEWTTEERVLFYIKDKHFEIFDEAMDAIVRQDIEKEEQRRLLKEITEADENDGLYDDWDNTIQDGLDDELNNKEK